MSPFSLPETQAYYPADVSPKPSSPKPARRAAAPAGRPSALLDTRIIYCGDCLDQLQKLPDGCVDLIYIDPPFNSNRNYEVFWGETKEKRAFEDRHASTQAYIEYMRPRCVELARVLKKTGSFYYHCDWHASHYVKVMLDQILRREQLSERDRVASEPQRHNDSKRYGCEPRHDLLLHRRRRVDVERQQYHALLRGLHRAELPLQGREGTTFRVSDMTANKPGGDVSYEWTTPDGRKVLAVQGTYWALLEGEHDGYGRQGRSSTIARRACRCSSITWTRCPAFRFKRSGTTSTRSSQAVRNASGYPTQKPLALLERIINSQQQPQRHRPRRVLRLRHRARRRREPRPPVDRHRHFAHRLPRHGQAPARRVQDSRG